MIGMQSVQVALLAAEAYKNSLIPFGEEKEQIIVVFLISGSLAKPISQYYNTSPSYSITYGNYTACSTLYNCGNIKNVGFPFWGQGRPEGCGYPELYLHCSAGSTFITIRSVSYLVLNADPDQHIMTIARFDYGQNLCPNQLLNTSLDPQLFENVPETKNLTLFYGCPPSIPLVNPLRFICPKDWFDHSYGYVLPDNVPEISVLCSTSVVVPVKAPTSLADLRVLSIVQRMLNDGFEIKWIPGIVECDECQKRGGVCGYDWGSNKTTCYNRRGNSTPQPQGTSDDGLTNVTFVYDCPSSPPFLSNSQDTNCKGADDDTNITVYYLPGPWYFSDCESVIMPIYEANFGRVQAAIQDVLRDEFGLQWMVNTEDCNTCSQSGGQCGYDGQFSCFCKDGPQKTSCPGKTSGIEPWIWDMSL
ncbi:LEAF RUST 10 DISEASE-RESISTANCE LOCUS RECEPTOR-LIKE PROTEIN KINASE-like 2.7 [Neltuma alba]|uniref:LEAF RUST 10 DISEASE-RESISTANCE LOCUS RECEPTOR-LIKE PROTEIN KINASE-like 2.7 n=1 Tax=Neltuma alba TaxID=207710 RepID=UPI0010A4FE84|nr:LEAF RUST 10 DISEASE-RESISTANCE LOCUS RECEPTOR-LIKE PROTEIN KINASE-like 2.7 [Prosopis alba]